MSIQGSCSGIRMRESMKISVSSIPHSEQRYPTVGDYFYSEGALQIRVSDLGDSRMEACVAVHEIIEALLCEARGVKEKVVDKFDLAYEARRASGEVNG